MTIQELKDLVLQKITGQGNQIDAGSALPPVLNGILDILAATQSITQVIVTVDEGTGTPSAEVSVADGVLTLNFHNLKGEKGEKGEQGEQGNTGSSVDYPFELVNNLTTNDATKALSAAQGVVLDDKISRLGQEVVNTHFVGANNIAVSFTLPAIKPGNKYLIIPTQSTFDISGITLTGGNSVFLFRYINQDDTYTNSDVNVTINTLNQHGLAPYYILSVPSDKKGVLFYGRATAGTKVRFSVYDITYLEENFIKSGILAYFEQQVERVIDEATKDIADVGHNGDNFVFVTDIHWERNAKHSLDLIKHICANLCIDNVVFGGDVIDGQAEQQIAREYFRTVANGLRSAESHFAAVAGNHDYNSASGGTAFANGEQTYYALVQKPNDYRVEAYTGKGYYYFDNITCNTRFIVLNSGIGYAIDATQEAWLRGILTDTPQDRHIVLFVHTYLRENSRYEEGIFIGYDFSVASSGVTIQSVLADFVGTKTIEAVIAGHAHLDANGMTDTGIPVVVTDCDGRASMMWPYTLGTINEQSFDVVTIDYSNKIITCRRVGRGKSRIIHYAINELSVGNTLDITSLTSIVPTAYSVRDNFSLQYRNAAGGGTGVTFNGTHASINDGIVTAISPGQVVVVAENDGCIETFNVVIATD